MHALHFGRTSSGVARCSIALAALALSACATSPSAPSGEQSVQITFDARVGAKPLKCGESYAGVGSSKATMMLQDFRIYVSKVRLISADGSEVPLLLTPDNQWQNDKVTLLDFENATGSCNGNAPMNNAVRGTAPAGHYTGVVFEIGVPQDMNHQDPTLAGVPLNYSGLTWPWRFGYKFTTIDLETANKAGGGAAMASAQPPAGGMKNGMHGMGGMAATGFSIHLGSTDCGAGSPTTPPSSPCATSNRPTFRLDGFSPAKQNVVLDPGDLLAGNDVTVNAPNSASGCMSGADDGDCVAIMERFGLTFRGKSSAGQTFVKAS